MTRKRSIIIFWALILVPTMIISSIALRLLKKEQDRINQSAVTVFTDRAYTISHTIHLTVQAVQENLTQSLMEIDLDHLEKTLVEWEAVNPLVRNVFIFDLEKNLEYPIRGMESTSEQRHFIARYDALFSGRLPFGYDHHLSTQESSTSVQGNADPGAYGGKTEKKLSSRQKLLALSRVSKPADNDTGQTDLAFKKKGIFQGFITKSGWLPWFSENRLFILGWVQPLENGPVYGIELELMTLLSRLVVDFPASSETSTALVLMDGNGKFMHQAGRLIVTPEDKPESMISVSTLLPHWSIAVFIDKKGIAQGKGFFYLSGLLLLIFIVAIFSGGWLLTRLTLENIKDARQILRDLGGDLTFTPMPENGSCFTARIKTDDIG